MARRAGAGDLERWLSGPPQSPDIIVVGLQEIVELEIKKNASTDRGRGTHGGRG